MIFLTQMLRPSGVQLHYQFVMVQTCNDDF